MGFFMAWRIDARAGECCARIAQTAVGAEGVEGLLGTGCSFFIHMAAQKWMKLLDIVMPE
jgi:hypothetical protein